MSQKYTAEEVRHCAKYINPSNPVGYSGMLTQATAMLTAYADSIERAQAGVTDEVVGQAYAARDVTFHCTGHMDETEKPLALDDVRAALLAAQGQSPASPAGVPDGWVRVPREPTEAMQTAHHIYGDTSDWWSAVIAAVPSASEGESHE